ncbi:MAG: VacJ family lipoprotein [Thermodesulfobacteriota bacterium]
MKRLLILSTIILTIFIFSSSKAGAMGPGLHPERFYLTGLVEMRDYTEVAALDESDFSDDDDFEDDDFDDEYGDDETSLIADPLEGFNRAMFVFNDKMYFWIMKPVARGYGFVFPKPGRNMVKRFFLNLRTPIRFVNSVLQLKFEDAGSELWRFTVNSTLGLGGMFDPAKSLAGMHMKREDMGQTFGRYGAGPGFYITWPFLGPSSFRDTLGLIGDTPLDPVTYLTPQDRWISTPTKVYDKLNNLSLQIGLYEGIKQDALDPYTYIRDAYHQYREKLVSE